MWADVAHHHCDLWEDPAVSPETAALIARGRRMSGVDYARSRAQGDHVRRQFTDALQRFDVLLTLATPYPAPRADEVEAAVTGGVLDVHRGCPARFTVPINEAGLPAVAFPVGTTLEGLPLGAQLIGPAHSDERLLAVVAAYQDAHPDEAVAVRREC